MYVFSIILKPAEGEKTINCNEQFCELGKHNLVESQSSSSNCATLHMLSHNYINFHSFSQIQIHM